MIQACKEIRSDILNISHKSGHGHIPTCFSVVEMLYAVYGTMKHDPANPNWEDRDIFVLSKGHAALALYVNLAKAGYFPTSAIESFGGYCSMFGCHADRLKIPGIEASTGSLGHGIGIAAGMALALKIQKSNRRVFSLIGDGEANEGSVWETILVSVDRGLDNFTILYDNNQSHARGLQIKDPVLKFEGFGCDVDEVDGHDFGQLKQSLIRRTDKVRVIVANTVKGYGCSMLVNDPYEWHRRPPRENELRAMLEELDAKTI